MTSKPSKSRAPRVVAAVIVLAGVVAALSYRAKAHVEGPLTFYGNVDIRDVTLAFRVAGRVQAVLKKEGDRVEPGETVARLDAAPYQVALEQARSTVAVAKAQLARAEAGFRREDISEARAMLAERRAASRRADDTYERAARLVDAGASTAATLDDARAARDQGRAAVKAAEAAVARVVSGARVEDVAVARAQVAQAEAAVAAAELSLADTELKAATAGVVVTRAIEPGAIVGAGSPTLVVAFDNPVWIRAFTSEKALASVAPGTPVDVYTDARPGEPYHGQVGYVAAQAEFTPKNVETAELRSSLVYRFRVVVTTHDGGLRQGMPVTVRLGAARAPAPALHETALGADGGV